MRTHEETERVSMLFLANFPVIRKALRGRQLKQLDKYGRFAEKRYRTDGRLIEDERRSDRFPKEHQINLNKSLVFILV